MPPTAENQAPISAPPAILLAAACSQFAFGASLTKTGEQTGLALPAATLVLFFGAPLVLLLRRRSPAFPQLAWSQALFLAAVSLGLLGMHRGELLPAAKELIQLAEIFLVSWYLFATLLQTDLPAIARAVGCIAPMLLLLGPGRTYQLPFIALSDTKYAALVALSFPFFLYRVKDLAPHRFYGFMLPAALAVGATCRNGGLLLTWAIAALVTAALAGPTLRRRTIPVIAIGLLLPTLVPRPAPSPWDTLRPAFDANHTKRLFIEYAAALHAPRRYPFGGGLGNYKTTINQLRRDIPRQPHPNDTRIAPDSNSQYLLTLTESGLPAAAALVALLVATLFGAFRYRRRHPEQDVAPALCGAAVALILAGCFTTILSRGIGIWTGALIGMVMADRRAIAIPWRLLRLLPPAATAAACLAMMWHCNLPPSPLQPISACNRYAREHLTGESAYDLGDRPVTWTEFGLPIVTVAADGGPAGDAIRIEAEAFTSVSGRFITVQANDASGNRAVEIPNASGKAIGDANYHIEIPTAGRYTLRARVFWQDGCSNSLGFQLADQTFTVSSELFGTWHTLSSPRHIDLPAGPVTLTIRNTEDGVRFDYFELAPHHQSAPQLTRR